MPKLPAIKAKDLIKVLLKHGYVLDHISGSHHILRSSDGHKTTIPVHGKGEIPKGTLLGILGDLGISKQEILKLLRK